MRRLLVLAAMLLARGVGAQAGGTEAAVAEIDRLLTAWHRAAAVADEATYFGTLAPDAVFLGTDAGERWTRPEFEKAYLPYFQRDSAWVFVATRRAITLSPDGDVAWFDELLDSKSYWACRGSGVLTRSGGRWLIRQYNLAFTIPNAVAKEVRTIVLAAPGQP